MATVCATGIDSIHPLNIQRMLRETAREGYGHRVSLVQYQYSYSPPNDLGTVVPWQCGTSDSRMRGSPTEEIVCLIFLNLSESMHAMNQVV